MPKIEIRCPSCSTIGYFEVSEKIVKQSIRGLVSVKLGKNQVCSHSFIAYIDRNFIVRDCFVTDFLVELPEMEVDSMKINKIPDSNVLDIDLIKINIYPLTLSYIIRSCLFKRKTLFLVDDEFLHNHLYQLFNFIFKNSFEIDISIEDSENYKKSKKSYKDFIILDNRKIIRDKNKILNPKKIKIERSFIHRFFAETAPNVNLIMLKNDIFKAFIISKEIMELISNYEGKEKLGKIKLINMLGEKKVIHISSLYLEFLLEVIKNYFKFDLSRLSSYFVSALGI